MNFMKFMVTPIPQVSSTHRTVAFVSSGAMFTGFGILQARLKQESLVKGGVMGGGCGVGIMSSLYFGTPLSYLGCIAVAFGAHYLFGD